MRQALVVGLISGGIYGLYALGLVLVYKGSGVLNFAQAEIGTFALYIAQLIVTVHGMPYPLGALAAIASSIAIGLVFERAAVRPLRSASRLTVCVATIGLLSLLIALEIIFYGPLPRLMRPPIGGLGVSVGGVIVSPTQIVSLVVVAGVGLALAAFLRGTDFGLGVLAAAQDQEAVRFLGIRFSRVSIFTWGVAAGLSGLAALLIQPTVGVISPNAFGGVFIKSLAAALIGGLASLPGAFVGGIIVGVLESQVTHATVNTNFPGLAELVVFAAILAVLLFRPQGLVPER